MGLIDNEVALVLEMSRSIMIRGSERKLSKTLCKTELREHLLVGTSLHRGQLIPGTDLLV